MRSIRTAEQPFSGTGANSYIADGSNVVQDNLTISDGGIGGKHPYLKGVTPPSYIGATNQDDHAWVSGVLSLADTDMLKNGGSEDPIWVEGVQSPVVVMPEKPESVTTRMVTVEGTAEVEAGRSIESVEITTGSGTVGKIKWTATLELPDTGENSFVLTAPDNAGMSSDISFSINREDGSAQPAGLTPYPAKP